MKNLNLPSAVFGALAVIGLLSLLSSSNAPEKTPEPQKWEYQLIISSPGKDRLDRARGGLNIMGRDGWELAGVCIDAEKYFTYCLKRPLKSK